MKSNHRKPNQKARRLSTGQLHRSFNNGQLNRRLLTINSLNLIANDSARSMTERQTAVEMIGDVFDEIRQSFFPLSVPGYAQLMNQ